MKKHGLLYVVIVCIMCLLFALTGCGGSTTGKPSQVGNDTVTGGENDNENNNADNTQGGNGENDESDIQKVLVAYFSCTNTTKNVAEKINDQISGSDIYRITPAVPYTSADLNYNTDCRANREQNDATARPAISGGVENIEQYDVIFIGYPIWWGQAPKIIYTFFESYDYDFVGVTIIPFCTSGSSGIGSSATNLHSLAPSANWKSGARISGTNVSSLISQME